MHRGVRRFGADAADAGIFLSLLTGIGDDAGPKRRGEKSFGRVMLLLMLARCH